MPLSEGLNQLTYINVNTAHMKRNAIKIKCNITLPDIFQSGRRNVRGYNKVIMFINSKQKISHYCKLEIKMNY